MLGSAVQPGIIRDGRLIGITERLASQTGLAVAVFGMVGLKAQIFSWRGGKRPLCTTGRAGFSGGQQEQLSNSAVGWLLLSTVTQPRRDSMIRHLNAEAAPEQKFCFSQMAATVQQCREQGNAIGVAGFGSIADIAAVLIPGQPENQPLALGFVYEPSELIDPIALLESLNDALVRGTEEQFRASATVQPLFNVA